MTRAFDPWKGPRGVVVFYFACHGEEVQCEVRIEKLHEATRVEFSDAFGVSPTKAIVDGREP